MREQPAVYSREQGVRRAYDPTRDCVGPALLKGCPEEQENRRGEMKVLARRRSYCALELEDL